jgi:hypothetical protein
MSRPPPPADWNHFRSGLVLLATFNSVGRRFRVNLGSVLLTQEITMSIRPWTSSLLGVLLLLLATTAARAQSFSAVASGSGLRITAVRQTVAGGSARAQGFSSVAQGSGISLAGQPRAVGARRAQSFASVAQGPGIAIVDRAPAAMMAHAADDVSSGRSASRRGARPRAR